MCYVAVVVAGGVSWRLLSGYPVGCCELCYNLINSLHVSMSQQFDRPVFEVRDSLVSEI